VAGNATEQTQGNTMSGDEGSQTRIKGLGENREADLDDISTQLLRDKSNQVIGRLTVIEGPGTDKSVKVYSGTNQVGRGDDQRVQLNFGDDTISRHQHAIITYDSKLLEARIYDGGKPGGLWVNGARVSESQTIKYGDNIKLGETTFRFEAP